MKAKLRSLKMAYASSKHSTQSVFFQLGCTERQLEAAQNKINVLKWEIFEVRVA